jgi:hypothetical protein
VFSGVVCKVGTPDEIETRGGIFSIVTGVTKPLEVTTLTDTGTFTGI